MGKWTFIIYCFLFLFDNTYCQDQNEEIFSDIFIVDSSVVYVTSQSKYILSYPSEIINAIYKTTDGGENWIRTQANISDKINNVYFVSADTGYITGYYSSKLYRTTNGGETWDSIYSFQNEIRDMKFSTSQIGFIVGVYFGENIYKTSDGGYTWSAHFSDSYQFVGTNLSVVNENVIFASNLYNDLSKSIDGGENWSIMNSVITDSVLFISDMQFIDEQNGFILGHGVYSYDGEINQTGPYLLRSSDSGKHWKSKLFTPNTSITDMYFPNATEGWLLSSTGSIYYSNNKFSTFDSTQLSISKFDFQNNISFGISEKNIYKSNDGWNTFNKLLTITSVEAENSVKLQFKLSQNYPNPFNPITTIQYTIPQSGNVKLELYDLLGRKIKTYINAIKSSGNYDIILNLSEFSSGVYIYKLSLENISINKKLILMK